MNSVFLHLRQLLLFANKSKTDLLFRTINIINLGRCALTTARREGHVEVEHRVPLTSIVPFSLSLSISVTFVIFRFGVMTYMSLWLISNRSRVPLTLCFIGQAGLLIMTTMNFLLFFRLLKSDYLRKND